jgi:hypothetical protein
VPREIQQTRRRAQANRLTLTATAAVLTLTTAVQGLTTRPRLLADSDPAAVVPWTLILLPKAPYAAGGGLRGSFRGLVLGLVGVADVGIASNLMAQNGVGKGSLRYDAREAT